MPKQSGTSMPRTLQRSPVKAQRTYAETLKSAEAEYGSGERASRTAYAALKHSFEKVGDHLEPKEKRGPSDPQAARTAEKDDKGASSRKGARDTKSRPKETFGGVDVLGHSRNELYARARDLDIRGRSNMNKEQLARAIAAKQG